MIEQPETVELFNITFSKVTLRDVFGQLDQRIAAAEPGFIVTPNVNHICMCHRDSQFREAYRKAFLALPDGVPVMWASRLFQKPLPEKLSGSDMVPILSEYAAAKGYSVYFLGGTPGTADQTASILKDAHPALNVAGCYCPPYGFENDPVENQRVLDLLRAAQPQICFVAFGSPKQELWLGRYFEETGVPVSIGVGASFDFISGRIRRAPVWIQHAGGEWLWRLAMEPRRLWRRYLVHDMVFVKIFLREVLRQARHAKATEVSR